MVSFVYLNRIVLNIKMAVNWYQDFYLCEDVYQYIFSLMNHRKNSGIYNLGKLKGKELL